MVVLLLYGWTDSTLFIRGAASQNPLSEMVRPSVSSKSRNELRYACVMLNKNGEIVLNCSLGIFSLSNQIINHVSMV